MGPLFYVINTFNMKEWFISKLFTSHFKFVKCIFFEFLNEGGRKDNEKDCFECDGCSLFFGVGF